MRYHSLIIDPESLPEELIPIAWTTSSGTISFLSSKESGKINGHETHNDQSTFVDSLLAEVGNGSLGNSSYYRKTRSTRVLMGIKHSTRPHYGLQVLCVEIIFV